MSQGQITVSLRELINPTPRQDDFLNAVKSHLYVLYGGAGGGGKSYILRWTMAGLLARWHTEGHVGVMVGLFCEDYPSLRDRHLKKLKREFPPWLGQMRESDHEFVLAPEFGSGVIAFRNLDDPSKYQSVEFAAIAVDELTRNERQTFDDLRWRRRWPGIPRCPFLAATNPGQIGHSWVKKLWIDRDFSGEPEALNPAEFAFIPAKAADNPHLPPEYLTELASLPEAMRRALLDGSWDLFSGQAFPEWRRDIHVCQPFPIPAWWRRWRSNDRGYGEPATWYWYAVSPDGQVYIYREWVCTQVRPSEQARQVLAMSRRGTEAPGAPVELDPATGELPVERFEFTAVPDDVNTSDPEGGKTWADLYVEGGLTDLLTVRRDPDVRAALMHEYLAPMPHPTQEGRQTARLQVFATCSYLIRTLPTLPSDPLRPNRVESGGEDHGFDGVGHGIQAWHSDTSRAPKLDEQHPILAAKKKLLQQMRNRQRFARRDPYGG